MHRRGGNAGHSATPGVSVDAHHLPYLERATWALQVDALRLGGEYFLTKPFNPVFLNAVVKSKIERYRALRRSMQHDGLTGLLNHRAIKDRLASAIHLAARTNSLLSVAMIDIDHFKTRQ